MSTSRRSSVATWAAFGVLVAVVTFLGVRLGHGAHLFGGLPFLLILACPLLHVFMHRGHGGHGGDDQREKAGARDASTAIQ